MQHKRRELAHAILGTVAVLSGVVAGLLVVGGIWYVLEVTP